MKTAKEETARLWSTCVSWRSTEREIQRIQREAFIRGTMTARGSHADKGTMSGALMALGEAVDAIGAVMKRKR